MKTTRSALAASAVLAAAALVIPSLQAAPSSSTRDAAPAFVSPPAELVQYGHVRSLARVGGRYVLRFDPALWLGGTTANVAAREDGVIGPVESVPNDYYVRDEGRKALTYRVPATARATVLVQGPRGIRSQRVGLAELAQIVKGRNPNGRRLYDRENHLGYWARTRIDTVRALDQQYQP
jgi:hypothetical protein